MLVEDSTMMLTIFLKHQQDQNLGEINAKLDASEFWHNFPPEDCEIVSWYVMMGIGQVVTLKFPPARLREVNLAIERRAWGAFETEFFATYDFRPRFDAIRSELGLASS
ncbi:MAG: hypothetical protein ACR2PG_11660 [Hyphomicrobiaceae bacterium]